jgi:hypothetical protein
MRIGVCPLETEAFEREFRRKNGMVTTNQSSYLLKAVALGVIVLNVGENCLTTD